MNEVPGPNLTNWRSRFIDPLLFSSVWMALAAAALSLAASRAMRIDTEPAPVGLVFFGILLVYNLDRLRDVERDRGTSPARSTFIETHRSALWALSSASAFCAGLILLGAGVKVWIISLLVLMLGFAHRRLKRFRYLKEGYLTIAWLLGIVGLPLAFAGGGAHPIWTAAALAPALLANDLGASARDREGLASELGAKGTLALGQSLSLLGIGVSLLAPAPVRPLAAVSLMTGLSLLAYRPGELYGFLVVDGALLFGAILALVIS